MPRQATEFWQPDDGLPAPDDPRFAETAAGFLAQHPVPSVDQQKRVLWDTGKSASRQLKCLAYLAGDKQPSRREVAELCVVQAIHLQWYFPVRVGLMQSKDIEERFDSRLFAAAGSLALTGGLLRNDAQPGSLAHQLGSQWLRTGLGQLEKYGSRADKNLYRAAMTVVDVVRPDAAVKELHGTDKQFFAALDLKRPDMREVARHAADGNWRRARDAYVEVLAERFSRKRGWPDLNQFKTADVAEADDICRNVFTIRAHMFLRHDFGEQMDWAKIINDDAESRVWMNAHPWMDTLVSAYQATGEDKYVEHLCRLFNSWYESSPPPFTRTMAQWRTLEDGNRTGQRWNMTLLALADHPTFQRECLFNMARSALDHGKHLSMYASGGGNWLQVESSGLACVGLLFPEFKLSPLFYQTAMNRLAWVNATSFLADGFQRECTPGYHYFPLKGIANSLRLANFLHAPIPKSLMKQYEAGVEVLQQIATRIKRFPC